MAQLNFDLPDDLPDDSSTSSDDEPYIHFEIVTYPSDFTLSVLYEKWQHKEIEIPPFQRGFVWKIEQASALIESFLLGLPVPNIFFYIDENNKSLVVDGQQRLKSIFYFFEGYFDEPEPKSGNRKIFKLQGLSEKSPYHNKKYEELGADAQIAFRDSVLRAMNIKQISPQQNDTSIYHIFERLNTGGTRLRPQEVRNSVFRGPFNEMLKEFNVNDENWRQILGSKLPNKFQKDVELLLRCVSLFDSIDQYEKPLKEHMNKHMKANQRVPGAKLESIRTRLSRTMKIIFEKLGSKPFHVRGPLNSAVLDCVTCAIMRNVDADHSALAERFKTLISNDRFKTLIGQSTSNETILRERFRLALEVLYQA